MTLDRRTLLKILVSTPLATLGEPALALTAAKQSSAASSFGTTSTALTGYPSNAGDAAKMRAAFATPERRAALARLERLVTATPATDLDRALHANGLDAIANELVAAWYSGIVTQGRVDRLVLYIDAYVWSAMSFTKPMGMCGGVTGYWSGPPK